MEKIWQKLADRFGQETIDKIRGAIDKIVGIWTLVKDVQERGISALWEYVAEPAQQPVGHGAPGGHGLDHGARSSTRSWRSC